MKNTIKMDEFNRMAYAILIMYSKFLEIPDSDIKNKIDEFNKTLNNKKAENDKPVQLGQDDQITDKLI